MPAKAWVYARTSGDEADTGQDVRAQVAFATARGQALGFQIVGASMDDGVSGDVPAKQRPGFLEASGKMLSGLVDAVVIVEASRFSRQAPAEALQCWDECTEVGLRVVCLKEAHFTTYGTDVASEDEAQTLLRFITFWTAWKELLTVRRRTQQAMTELKEGRRATKSGKPVGRPKKALSDAEMAKARSLLSADMSPARIANVLSHDRGAFTTTDPKLRRERAVSRQTVLRALGLDQNSDLPKTPVGQEEAEPDANRAVVDNACKATLDFSDGTRAACVNEKPHGADEGHVWSKSAWKAPA